MNISPTEVMRGIQRQTELAETNQTFENPEALKGSSQRMAGLQGARALALMTDPQAQADTANWMRLFGQSVQGMEFNQAKMMQGGISQ